MMQAAKNNDLNQFETLNQLAKDYLSTLIENRKKKINVRLMHTKNIVFICLWEFFAALPMRQTKWSKRTLSEKPHFSTAHHSYLSSNVSKYFRPNAYVFVF